MNVVGAFFKYQVNNFSLPLTQILLQDSLAQLGEPSLTGSTPEVTLETFLNVLF